MEHEREVCTFSVSFETPALSVFELKSHVDVDEDDGDDPGAGTGTALWSEIRLLFDPAV